MNAVAIINAAGESGDVAFTAHAQVEAFACGASAADVLHALAVASDAARQTDGSWRVASADLDGEALVVVVTIALYRGVTVVTVWRIE